MKYMYIHCQICFKNIYISLINAIIMHIIQYFKTGRYFSVQDLTSDKVCDQPSKVTQFLTPNKSLFIMFYSHLTL